MQVSPTIKTCANCKKVFATENDFLTGTSQWRLCSMENLWFDCECGSTLMLPKGKYPWYAPSIGMGDKAGEIFNKIAQTTTLPHIPSVIMELQLLLFNPEVETKDLVTAIKRDPFLASEIIRIAENIKGTRDPSPPPIRSLEHATTYIGRKSLKNLVLAAAIKSFKLPTEKFDETAFWQHSFLTASIAEDIAVRVGMAQERDHIYLSGCLCNVGKIISAVCYPEKIDELQTILDNVKTMTTWEMAESILNLPSHCIMGEIGGAIWGLPPQVIDCARYHHTVDLKTKEERSKVIYIVSLANLMAHWINLEPHRIDMLKLNFYSTSLNLNNADLEKIASDLSYLKTSLKIV